MNLSKIEKGKSQEDIVDSIDDLSEAEVIKTTNKELAALKQNIAKSSLFSDKEKESFSAALEGNLLSASINSEKQRTTIEEGTNYDLWLLLQDIRNFIVDDNVPGHLSNPDQKKILFESAWTWWSPEEYIGEKEKVTEKHKDLLLLWTVNNYFENTWKFKAIEGSAEEAFIQEYNNGDQVAQINFDILNSRDTNFANHSPIDQPSPNNTSKVADVDFRKNSPYTSWNNNYDSGVWNPNSGQPKNRPWEVA